MSQTCLCSFNFCGSESNEKKDEKEDTIENEKEGNIEKKRKPWNTAVVAKGPLAIMMTFLSMHDLIYNAPLVCSVWYRAFKDDLVCRKMDKY